MCATGIGWPAAASAWADLQRAARIGGDQQLSARRAHVAGLARAKLRRRRWLDQVVDACRAAAGAAVGDLGQHEAGNAGQQAARLRGDPLGVAEVTGVVVGDGQAQLGPRCDRSELGQELTEVADPGAERGRPASPDGIPGQQAPVLLHRRAAARRVRDDRVDAGLLESGDRPPSRTRRPRRGARRAARAHRSSPDRAAR